MNNRVTDTEDVSSNTDRKWPYHSAVLVKQDIAWKHCAQRWNTSPSQCIEPVVTVYTFEDGPPMSYVRNALHHGHMYLVVSRFNRWKYCPFFGRLAQQ
jgi:hypothetical protein